MPKSHAVPEKSLHPIAELYARWALNPLIAIAHAVSHDIVVRPQHYRNLSNNVASSLNDFRFKLGADPAWPDALQRTLSFKVLYHVNLASPPLREAALLYWQHHRNGNQKQHLDAFRHAAAAFRAQIASLEGQALTMICNQTRPIFERAVAVFQDPVITQAFGLSPAPAKDWPIGDNFSREAAYLISEMTRGLRQVYCLAGFYRRLGKANSENRPLMPLLTVALPQEKFIALQQAGYFGALTISNILLTDGDVISTEVIESAYEWIKALQKLVPDVSRAWKDLEYRSRLTDLEWGMAPNPAGDATPLSAFAGAAQTYTVRGEICCCSGDLDCVPETYQLTDFCTEFCTVA